MKGIEYCCIELVFINAGRNEKWKKLDQKMINE
jgi:hypothetical protein